ncbi:MAG: SDR family NAD(P)-dependent oxidoreductase [Lysobacterales bacterium]
MAVKFDNQVAVVTGAGAGLGRAHALGLAARGAKVVVNDLGAQRDGSGSSSLAAQGVVREIQAAGGEAIANGADITNVEQVGVMMAETLDRWGRIDVLVNNAGILRDKTFAKMPLEDFRAVLEVHLMGSVICCKAVWAHMMERRYGRIVVTTSSSGLYGNFGQSNYGAAKLGLVGLMNTLAIEGNKYGIHVNAISPVAATRMTKDVIPDPEKLAQLDPAAVTPAVLALCAKEGPTKTILCAGAGGYSQSQVCESDGIFLSANHRSPESVLGQLSEIGNPASWRALKFGGEQTQKFLQGDRSQE